jgi:hypothetical protein
MSRVAFALFALAVVSCGPMPDELAGPDDVTPETPDTEVPSTPASQSLVSECSPGGPPSDGVQLFERQNWGGVCKQWRMERFPHSGEYSLQGFNNWAQSVRVGSNVRVALFISTNFRIKFLSASQDVPAMTYRPSSMRLELRSMSPDCSNLNSNQLAFYEHANFQGDCFVVESAGFLSVHNISEWGLANDSVSSYRNPSNRTVILFEHHYEGGSNWVFPGGSFSFVGSSANDQTTSLRVQ